MRVRSLAVPFALSLAFAGCKKPADTGAGDGGATASSSGTPSSAPRSFDAAFEGTISLHATRAPSPATDFTLFAKGGSLRIDMPPQAGQVTHTLFDAKARTVTIIMDSQKLAIMTPLAPAPTGPAGQATVTPTGKRETVAGRECEDWDIVSGSGVHTSACVAAGLTFFDFVAIAGPRDTGTWADAVRDADVFPLRAVTLDAAGQESSRVEVTRIEPKTLSDALFHVPPGYDSEVVTHHARGGGAPGAAGAASAPPSPSPSHS